MIHPLTLETQAAWMAVLKYRNTRFVSEITDDVMSARQYISEVIESDQVAKVFVAPSVLELDKTRDVTVEFAALVAHYLMELSPYNWPLNLVAFAYAYGHRPALDTYDHEWRQENAE